MCVWYVCVVYIYMYACMHACRYVCMYVCVVHICIYVTHIYNVWYDDDIYICVWLLIESPFSASGHSSQIETLLSRNFRELHIYLSWGPCWATWRFIHHLRNSARLSGITSWSPCKHAASITEFLLRTNYCWLGHLCASFTGPPPSKYTLTSARSFAELPRNFRENNPIYCRCLPSAGGASKRKSKHQGPWCLALITFGSLAAAREACFLRLQKASLGSDSGRCKGVLQDHAWWYLAAAKPHLRKLGCYLWREKSISKSTTHHTGTEPDRNSPFSCRTPGGRGQ